MNRENVCNYCDSSANGGCTECNDHDKFYGKHDVESLVAEVERLKGENEIPKCPGKEVCRTRSDSCFNCIRSIGDLKGYTDNYREKVAK